MNSTIAPRPARLPIVEFRPDVEWTLHHEQGRWVARDPLTARFFYFSEAEHAATNLLNGHRTLGQVRAELDQAFPQLRLSIEWLIAFVSRLNAAHLLLPSSSDVVTRLLRTQRSARKRSLLQFLSSPLSVRIPLVNPQPWLELLRPVALVLFSQVTVTVAVVLGVLANLSVVVKLLTTPNSLTLDLASIQGDRWLLLIVCYVIVKSLHELGHGLACTRWRTQCNELGLLILFFTPCLYCDTTDAWKLSSRWQRAAIGAAGMYVELILASFAAIVWLLTHDGMVHSVAANIMLICSLGTVLINGNPFLKYDGYYILSDLWGVPNLSDQSREALMALFTGWMTGQPVEARHLDRNVWALAAYAIVSVIYRTFILIVILWLAWSMLVPLGLGFLALMVFVGTLLGLAISSIRFAQKLQVSVLSNQAFKISRLVLFLAFVCLLLAFVAQVPLPVYIRTRGVTDFKDKTPVFASDSATLVEVSASGQTLRPGEALLRFDSPEKRFELQTVEGEIVALQKKIDYLNQLASFDPSSSFELPPNQELLADRRAKAVLLKSELERLTQTAPYAGKLLPANAKLEKPLAAPRDFQWDTSPLDASNQGCLLQRGTLLGWFSRQQHLEVLALVSEQDIKRLRLGEVALCQWDRDVSSAVSGRISRISPDPIEQTPEELIGDPALISSRNHAGQYQPIEPYYAVTIAIDQVTGQHPKGSLVTVQIQVDAQPLLQTLIHAIRLSLKPI